MRAGGRLAAFWLVAASLFVAAFVTAASASCQRAGDKRAKAVRISDQAQLIGGPKALGEVGDYLLENDKIRVIIHGPGTNRATTLFPGALLDLDLRRPGGQNGNGNDQVGEIAPAFLFEAFNPTDFRITQDGSDGGPAVLTIDGTGDDLLEAVALINTGFLFPPALRFRVEYRLEPGASYVEMITTVINDGSTVHPLPFLDPPDLRDLGLDIPGLEELALSVPLGHFMLFGGEQAVFAPGAAGFNLRFAVEDSYSMAGGLPAFPGLVTDYLATRGNGVSYGVALPSSENNYANAFRDLYPGQEVTDRSILVPFLFSAVVATYSANPPAVLLPGGEFSFRVNIAVGGGDVGSVTDVIFSEIHDIATGTLGGRIYDGQVAGRPTEASVVVATSGGSFVTQADVDSEGDFTVNLPPGDYQYRVVSSGRLPTDSETFSIREGQTTSVLKFLEAPGGIAISVRDEQGRPLPSRVTIVGRFADADRGRDPREFLYDLPIGESERPTTFDANRSEFIEKSFYSHDGRFIRPVRPGLYDLVVSRGSEYDTVTEPIEVIAGQSAEKSIVLSRTVDTTGYVSADLHLHSANSVDSGLSLADRVISIAGEGVEFAAATDHNYVTDYSHEIAKHNLQQWMVSVVGLEITTFEMGHFNGYPLRHDSSSARGGNFEWVGTPPDEIFRQLRAMGEGGDAIVQVNHPRWDFLGYFNVFNLDQDLAEPVVRQGLRSVFAPTGPEFELGNFSLDFDVVEIINGKRYDLIHTYRTPEVLPPPPLPDPVPPTGEVVRDSSGQVAYPGAMEDWFALLNHGQRITGVGASDSHKLLGDEPGFPRTYVFVGGDGFGEFNAQDVTAGLRSRNATTSMGPFALISVNGQPIGSDVSDSDGTVDITVDVRAPNWSPFDKVKVWANAEVILEYDVDSSESLSFQRTESVALAADTWVLVEVTGSANLFPVIPPKEYESLSPTTVIGALASGFDLSALDPSGNLRPSETTISTPYAFSNPIWIDVDGNGTFDPPRTSGLGPPPVQPRRRGKAAEPKAPAPELDVREWFDGFEEGKQ